MDFCTPFIDVIVTGEGVFPFKEVIARLEKKTDLSAIPGAVRMENGAIIINQLAQDIDLDALPFPRRDLTVGIPKIILQRVDETPCVDTHIEGMSLQMSVLRALESNRRALFCQETGVHRRRAGHHQGEVCLLLGR